LNLQNIKLIYIISCILLGLAILLPTFFAVVPFPKSEIFSELWLLGSNHMIETGSVNVVLNKPYTVYLGVGNHMEALKYYKVFVKFRSQFQAFNETGTVLHNSLKPIFEYRMFLKNNEIWEKDFTFSFENVSFEGNVSRVSLISINDNDVNVDTLLVRDESDGGFYCQMFFELWIFDSTISDFQYHNRSAWFWLNLDQML